LFDVIESQRPGLAGDLLEIVTAYGQRFDHCERLQRGGGRQPSIAAAAAADRPVDHQREVVLRAPRAGVGMHEDAGAASDEATEPAADELADPTGWLARYEQRLTKQFPQDVMAAITRGRGHRKPPPVISNVDLLDLNDSLVEHIRRLQTFRSDGRALHAQRYLLNSVGVPRIAARRSSKAADQWPPLWKALIVGVGFTWNAPEPSPEELAEMVDACRTSKPAQAALKILAVFRRMSEGAVENVLTAERRRRKRDVGVEADPPPELDSWDAWAWGVRAEVLARRRDARQRGTPASP
jgi:hypothetical protein